MKTLLQGKEYIPASETDILKTFMATGWVPPSTKRFGKLEGDTRMHEYECHADIDGERVLCSAAYELEKGGYKPLIYGIFALDEHDTDITLRIPEYEFDRIYDEICQHVAENMTGE